MTVLSRDDVIRMAREAELIHSDDARCMWIEDVDLTPYLERFAALIAAAVHSEGSAK